MFEESALYHNCHYCPMHEAIYKSCTSKCFKYVELFFKMLNLCAKFKLKGVNR